MKPILYLLSGNGSIQSWWEDSLPYFSQLEAVPLELPGFGDNLSNEFHSLDQLARALIEMTQPGSRIFAAGVNGLVVLRALVLKPGHFKEVMLLAPVGAFLWERRFVKLMSPKPIRKIIHFLLRNYPKLFKRKFSSQQWTDAQYQRMGEGYQKCRAFQTYFDIVKAENALDFLDRIDTSIELIWGTRDAVLDASQVVAWDSILPRADLTVTVKEDWGHYPYIDDPIEFASYMETQSKGWLAHTKSGRLRLARLGGLPVPAFLTLHASTPLSSQLSPNSSLLSQLNKKATYALRSSEKEEDHIDHSHAGQNKTLLQVPHTALETQLKSLFAEGAQEVVVQEFIQPKVSGVAFVRWVGAEIEWVEGHLEELLAGQEQGQRLILSKMEGEWEDIPPTFTGFPYDLTLDKLQEFLRQCIRLFHYAQADIEWAWDGKQFYLFQIRPITSYNWRRCITSANLDEILPKQVSRLMEQAQRWGSPHIGKVMGRWDPEIFRENEPFSVLYEDASYINSDLFLARFSAWGLPSMMYGKEIGGAVPHLPFRLLKALRSFPVFVKMGFACRGGIKEIAPALAQFDTELTHLIERNAPDLENELVNWFTRYYLFIVRSNILINTAISTSLFGGIFRRKTAYDTLKQEALPHRLVYESDPATPRSRETPRSLLPLPQWPAAARVLHSLGIPGLRDLYIEIREWFRDNNMRLFHRLHLAMEGSEWLELYPSTRGKQGTFWQDGGVTLSQEYSFVIYPGTVEGVLGEDIMWVDALDPGKFQQYREARAVIARMGGQLSHGATLLRELKKPSAVSQSVEEAWRGKRVRFRDGEVELV